MVASEQWQAPMIAVSSYHAAEGSTILLCWAYRELSLIQKTARAMLKWWAPTQQGCDNVVAHVMCGLMVGGSQ